MEKQQGLIPGVEYFSFKELFDNERSFEIPDFQRAYDWGLSQRKDLLTDLEKLDELSKVSDEPVSHFCGTVICTPPKQSGCPYAVVDGQQRLTTMSLLHGRLTKNKETTFLREPGRMRFKPQPMDRDTFDRLVRGETPQEARTLAQANYAAATKEIDVWINEDKARSERVLRLVEANLHFIFFVLRDDTEVAKVFETINNRGKPLSQMDLVKNHLIYISAINGWETPNVNEVWKNIQQIVAETRFLDGDVDTILRATVTAQFKPGKRKAGETDFSIVTRELTAECEHEQFALFLSFLETSFRSFKNLRSANDTDPKDRVARALTHLNHHDSITGVLPLIFARQFQRIVAGETGRDAPVLEAIEIANFRLYGLPGEAARSDSYNVTLHNLAHKHFKNEMSGENVIAELRDLLAREQSNGLLSIIRSLSLNDDARFDFYNWGWLRYFLGRFEESLLDSQSFDFSRLRKAYGGSDHTNDYLSIEHICAQKSEATNVRKSNGGQQLRRLGNLMLLPHRLNVQLSNLEIELKEQKSDQAKVTLLRQNEEARKAARDAKKFTEILSLRKDGRFGAIKSRFNKNTLESNESLVFVRALCDLREEAMIAFALKAWRFPDEAASEHLFEGVFSFAHSGEAFTASQDNPANKLNENYVIRVKNRASNHAYARLRARHETTRRRDSHEHQITPVFWD